MSVDAVESPQLAQLSAAARVMGIELTDLQRGQLLQYMGLIQKWNKVYNLTALRDPAEMLTHHLLDSLAAVPPLQALLGQLRQRHGDKPVSLLDVGSGAGLPGVVFAICCPQLQVSCVDTVGKKAAFVQQAGVELGLPHLRGVHARVENLIERFDIISSRAFASLADFTAWSQQALAEEGVWLAMKGKTPTDEMASLPSTVDVFHVEQLSVPSLEADRCIVWMRQRKV